MYSRTDNRAAYRTAHSKLNTAFAATHADFVGDCQLWQEQPKQ